MGRCSWPASGGGIGLDYWEQWLPACELSFAPKPGLDGSKNAIAITTQHGGNEYDYQDTIAMPEKSVALGKFPMLDFIDITSPDFRFELHVFWEPEDGYAGTDFEITAGINIFQAGDVMNIHPITTGVPKIETATANDELFITKFDATLTIQTTVLSAPPYYLIPWLYRPGTEDENLGVMLVHGILVMYRMV